MAFYYIGNNVNVGKITSDSYNSCVGLAIYRNGNPNRGLLAHFWTSDVHHPNERVQHFKEDVQAILLEWGDIEVMHLLYESSSKPNNSFYLNNNRYLFNL